MINRSSTTSSFEFFIVAGLTVILFLLAFLATFIDFDPIIIGGSIVALALFLFAVEDALSLHLHYALCFGIACLPYINLTLFPVSAVYVVGIVYSLVVLVEALKNRQPITLPVPARWMLVLLALGFSTVAYAADKAAVITYAGQFFLYTCMYIAVCQVLHSKETIVRSLKYIVAGGLVTILIAIVQLLIGFISLNWVIDLFVNSTLGELFIGSRGLERLGNDADIIFNRGSNIADFSGLTLFRAFGTFEAPTIYGMYLQIMATLVAGLYFTAKGASKFLFPASANAALLLGFFVILCFTMTRSAILCFFISLAFILYLRNKKNLKIVTAYRVKVAAVLGGVGLMIILGALYFQIQLINVNALFDFSGSGSSTITRLLTMAFASYQIYQHPFIGVGLGNYKYVQPGENVAMGESSFITAHNTYLEVGVELGLPGIVVFLFLLRSFFAQSTALTGAARGSIYHTLGVTFYTIWVGFAALSMFGGNLVHPRFITLLWVLAGIQTALVTIYTNEQQTCAVYRIAAAD